MCAQGVPSTTTNRPQKPSASGMLTDGGITSRSGSFGWSWWTPWMIQWRRAPEALLRLEVEDQPVHPVLGERPEDVAREHEADHLDGRGLASGADGERHDDRRDEDHERDHRMHA